MKSDIFGSPRVHQGRAPPLPWPGRLLFPSHPAALTVLCQLYVSIVSLAHSCQALEVLGLALWHVDNLWLLGMLIPFLGES